MTPDLRVDDLVYIIGLDMVEARIVRIDVAVSIDGTRRYHILCEDKYHIQKYYAASQVVTVGRLFQETSIQPPTLAEYDSILSTLNRINQL